MPPATARLGKHPQRGLVSRTEGKHAAGQPDHRLDHVIGEELGPAILSGRVRELVGEGGGRAEDDSEPAGRQPERHVVHRVEDGGQVARLAWLIRELGDYHVWVAKRVGQFPVDPDVQVTLVDAVDEHPTSCQPRQRRVGLGGGDPRRVVRAEETHDLGE